STGLLAPASGGVFVGMLDADGQTAWVLSPSPGEASSAVVGLDADGNVMVYGGFGYTLDFGSSHLQAQGIDAFLAKLDKEGPPLWAKQFTSANGNMTTTGVAVDGAGNIAIGGGFYGTLSFGGPVLESQSYGQVSFVAKLDPNGAHIFSTGFGGGPNSV